MNLQEKYNQRLKNRKRSTKNSPWRYQKIKSKVPEDAIALIEFIKIKRKKH